MTGAYVALLLVSVVMTVTAFLRGNPRGALWLLLAQVFFWFGVGYWDVSGPLPFLFAAICDSIIVYMIYRFGKERWEEWLLFVFVGSILVNFAAQAAQIFMTDFNVYVHAFSLYALNWIAFFIVGGATGFKAKGYGRDYFAFADWTSFLGRERAFERQTRTAEKPK